MSIDMVGLGNCDSALVGFLRDFEAFSSLLDDATITNKSINVVRFLFKHNVKKALSFLEVGLISLSHQDFRSLS